MQKLFQNALSLIRSSLKSKVLFFDLLQSGDFNSYLLLKLFNQLVPTVECPDISVKFQDKEKEQVLVVKVNKQQNAFPVPRIFKVSKAAINRLNINGPLPFVPISAAPLPEEKIGLVQLNYKEIALLNSLDIFIRNGMSPIERKENTYSVGLDIYEILATYPNIDTLKARCAKLIPQLDESVQIGSTEVDAFVEKMANVIEVGIALVDISDQMRTIAIGGGKKQRAQAKKIQEKFDSVKVWIRNKVQRISETAKRITPPKRKPQPVKKQAKKKPL
jgi:hypothetical protein